MQRSQAVEPAILSTKAARVVRVQVADLLCKRMVPLAQPQIV